MTYKEAAPLETSWATVSSEACGSCRTNLFSGPLIMSFLMHKSTGTFSCSSIRGMSCMSPAHLTSQWQSERCELAPASWSLIHQKFYKVNQSLAPISLSSMLSSVWGKISHSNVAPPPPGRDNGREVVGSQWCRGCKGSLHGVREMTRTDRKRGWKTNTARWDDEKSQEAEIDVMKSQRGGAARRGTGLMAQPSAGSLLWAGAINEHVTVINIVWQVISTLTHVPQGHCWRKGP